MKSIIVRLMIVLTFTVYSQTKEYSPKLYATTIDSLLQPNIKLKINPKQKVLDGLGIQFRIEIDTPLDIQYLNPLSLLSPTLEVKQNGVFSKVNIEGCDFSDCIISMMLKKTSNLEGVKTKCKLLHANLDGNVIDEDIAIYKERLDLKNKVLVGSFSINKVKIDDKIVSLSKGTYYLTLTMGYDCGNRQTYTTVLFQRIPILLK